MKALKILGVVFGALLLLAGGALLAGSALVTQGRGAFDQHVAHNPAPSPSGSRHEGHNGGSATSSASRNDDVSASRICAKREGCERAVSSPDMLGS